MAKKYKIKIEGLDNLPKYAWAFQVLFFSLSMSIVLGLLSQTLLNHLGVVISIICIVFLIFLAVIFDMFGIAVASANENLFIQWRKEGKLGASAGLHLCENSEKVCSFCADVVGDICSTLCGAAGACIVMALCAHVTSTSFSIFISTLVSAIIASLTIFFKALMKEYAITKSNKIILKAGRVIEKWLLRRQKRKNKKVKNRQKKDI